MARIMSIVAIEGNHLPEFFLSRFYPPGFFGVALLDSGDYIMSQRNHFAASQGGE